MDAHAEALKNRTNESLGELIHSSDQGFSPGTLSNFPIVNAIHPLSTALRKCKDRITRIPILFIKSLKENAEGETSAYFYR